MEAPESNDINRRIAAVRERIAAAAHRANRSPETITLCAVTKTVSAGRVAAAFRAGLRDFGENYVQEAREKIPAVEQALAADDEKPIWHLIGHLQSNKAKYSVDLFSHIQSVDNYSLAQEIAKQAAKKEKIQSILLEVNLARDPARAGILPEDALTLAEQVIALPALSLEGLMGMAPFFRESEAARPFFQELRRLYEKLPETNRRILSMGMSGDFEIAIEEGATLVRIGTALFGTRQAP